MEKKSNYKERRSLDAIYVRELCIKKSWYTRGDNEAYSKLLEYADEATESDEGVTVYDLEQMAKDILEHSELDEWYAIESIMFELNRAAVVSYSWAEH